MRDVVFEPTAMSSGESALYGAAGSRRHLHDDAIAPFDAETRDRDDAEVVRYTSFRRDLWVIDGPAPSIAD